MPDRKRPRAPRVPTARCLRCEEKQATIDYLQGLILRLVPEAIKPAPIPPGPEYPPMEEAIELFLDAKFIHGTSRWKQQRREAEKLVNAGQNADFVIETLSRGQAVEF